MNAKQLKQVQTIVAQIQELQSQFEPLVSELRELQEAESEKNDNLPDSLRDSERGQAIDAAASVLEEAADRADEALSSLEDVVEVLGGLE